MKRISIVALSLALILGVSLLVLHRARRPPAPEATPSAPPVSGARPDLTAPPTPPAGGETQVGAAPAKLPASLAGTVPDGGLPLDAHGHLRVVADVRRFFDYFLTAMGEEEPTAIRARIVAEIEARLPPAAAKEAIDLLDSYLDYMADAQVISVTGLDGGEDLQARLDTLWRLRREVLGDQIAETFFGEDEQVASVELERMRIAKDPNLSPEERRREVEALDERLPESVRAARAEAQAPTRLWQDEQALRAKGATPEEIWALREERFGREAAYRLEDLDRERAEWQGRMDAYHQERQQILEDTRLSEEERAAALKDLLQNNFSPPERIRLQALEDIAAQGRTAPGKPSAPR